MANHAEVNNIMLAFLWFLYKMSENIYSAGGNISMKVIEDIILPYTLRGFLASKRCSSPGLNCRYLHQIKAYIAGYQTISRCFKQNELSSSSRPLMRASYHFFKAAI